MQMNSCFFIGHADAPESVLVQLMQTIEELIAKENIRYFYVGKHGNFDRLAALAVKNLKKSYPFIQLILVLPYHPGERSILVPDGFDGTYYPEGMETVPKKYAIIKANRKMIENVDWLIAYDKPNCTRIELPWTKVVKYYDALVESGRFAPPEEKEQEATTVIDAEPIKETPETAEVKEPEAPAVEPPIAHRELTQADIDEALQKWNGSIDSKRSVVRYMEVHSRERDTASWLAREYGADPVQPLRITVTGVDAETVLPWANACGSGRNADTKRKGINGLPENTGIISATVSGHFPSPTRNGVPTASSSMRSLNMLRTRKSFVSQKSWQERIRSMNTGRTISRNARAKRC